MSCQLENEHAREEERVIAKLHTVPQASWMDNTKYYFDIPPKKISISNIIRNGMQWNAIRCNTMIHETYFCFFVSGSGDAMFEVLYDVV